MINLISFYFFSLVIIFSSIKVITSKNPVQAVLFLVLSFFTTACLWILLKAEFLAITLVLVYVGAVMVLFIFVVMMLDIRKLGDTNQKTSWLITSIVIGGIILLEIVLVFFNEELINLNMVNSFSETEISNTKELGRLIYTYYFYPFEIAAVILLVAIIAAISLTLRNRVDARKTHPDDQVSVKKKDRLKLIDIKLKSEK